MKFIYLLLFSIPFLKSFGQFSPIIDFPVNTYKFRGAPLMDHNGDTVTFDLTVYYSIPQNPRGIIYFFHGGGGSGGSWLHLVEQPMLLTEAISRGYGIITMDSNNRNGNVWDIGTDMTGNIVGQNDSHDTDNLWKVHQNMVISGKYRKETPLFAVGFSNGGAFTSRLGLRASSYYLKNENILANVNNILPFKAVAIYGALGSYAKVPEYDIPSIFNVGINDNKVPPFPNMTNHPDWPYEPQNSVIFTVEQLENWGVSIEFNVKPEEPINPFMFTIIPGIDSLGSSLIYDSLKTIKHPSTGMPFIDSKDSLQVHPGITNFWKEFIPQPYQNKRSQIEQQLNVKFAGHVVFREFRDETLDFFDTYLETTTVSSKHRLTEQISNIMIFPSPFIDELNIAYEIQELCHLDLQIYDLYGRVVYEEINQLRYPGSYHLICRPGNELSQIPRGTYYGKLRSKKQIELFEIIKL